MTDAFDRAVERSAQITEERRTAALRRRRSMRRVGAFGHTVVYLAVIAPFAWAWLRSPARTPWFLVAATLWGAALASHVAGALWYGRREAVFLKGFVAHATLFAGFAAFTAWWAWQRSTGGVFWVLVAAGAAWSVAVALHWAGRHHHWSLRYGRWTGGIA